MSWSIFGSLFQHNGRRTLLRAVPLCVERLGDRIMLDAAADADAAAALAEADADAAETEAAASADAAAGAAAADAEAAALAEEPPAPAPEPAPPPPIPGVFFDVTPVAADCFPDAIFANKVVVTFAGTTTSPVNGSVVVSVDTVASSTFAQMAPADSFGGGLSVPLAAGYTVTFSLRDGQGAEKASATADVICPQPPMPPPPAGTHHEPLISDDDDDDDDIVVQAA